MNIFYTSGQKIGPPPHVNPLAHPPPSQMNKRLRVPALHGPLRKDDRHEPSSESNSNSIEQPMNKGFRAPASALLLLLIHILLLCATGLFFSTTLSNKQTHSNNNNNNKQTTQTHKQQFFHHPLK